MQNFRNRALVALAAVTVGAFAVAETSMALAGHLDANEVDKRTYTLDAGSHDVDVVSTGGDADIYVYNADTNKLIVKDDDKDSFPMVRFRLAERTRVRVEILNSGTEVSTYSGDIYNNTLAGRLESGEEFSMPYSMRKGTWDIKVEGAGGDLDAYVYDARTGRLLQADVEDDNQPSIKLNLTERTPVKIVIRNNGDDPASFKGEIQ